MDKGVPAESFFLKGCFSMAHFVLSSRTMLIYLLLLLALVAVGITLMSVTGYLWPAPNTVQIRRISSSIIIKLINKKGEPNSFERLAQETVPRRGEDDSP
jgi:hypothetical protein